MTSKLLTAGSVAPIDEVLTWLIQSTVLLAVGLLAGRFLKGRGPAVQSALYRTILVAVLVCPIASMAIAAMGFPGLVIRVPGVVADDQIKVADRGPDRIGPIARHGSNAIPTSFDRRAIAPSEVEPGQALNPLGLPVGAPSTAEPPSVLSAGTTPEPVESVTGPDWIASMASIILAFWLLVAAILAMRLLVGHRRMARLRGTAFPAEPEAQALCHELAGRMRLRLPGVLRSPFLSSPCLDGLRRPAILLPEDADENLRDTFVHELAHLGRRDGLWNLLRQLATAALWVQPLLWVLSRRIEQTAEEVCDDFVVAFGADRCRYAGHLLELARRRLPPLAPAGVGMISLRSLLARRIARILDSTRSLSTRAGRRTLTATLLAGLAGTILAGLVGVGGGSRDLLADETKPGRSATAGDPKPAQFNAATGQATNTPEPPTAVKHDQSKVAARDVPITGRIVDLEGRPIRGVTVQVDSTWAGSISKARGGDMTPWMEAVRRGEPPGVAHRHLEDYKVAYRHLEDYKKEQRGKAETDAQGRFRLEGLGAEKVITLSIEGPTVAHTQLMVVTRRVEPFPAEGFPNMYGPGTQTIYGADFTLTAAPGRVIEGVVRDVADKKVMKSVDVWSYCFSGSRSHGMWSLKTRTDAEGRFRLAGFPKGRGNELLIVPNDDQPYFMQEFAIPDPPGLGPIPVEIDLHRGIWIEGKLTDKETGAPVAGARLHYLPFLANKLVLAVPEFHANGMTDGVGHQHRYVSKADGTYRLVGLPGRAIVGALAVSGRPYRQGAGAESIKGIDEKGRFATWMNPTMAGRYFPTSMNEINPPEGTETVHLDLELDAGAKVRLRLVDSQGKPVTGVKAAGRRERGEYDRDVNAEAEFDVVTLGPEEDRMVLLVHEGRKLGRVIHVKEGDDKNGPVVVALEPAASITGCVADPDGNPISGASVRTYPEPSVAFSISLPQIASDKNGKFTVPSVPTGCEYSLEVESGATPRQWRRAFFQHAAVRPGKTTDVGDLRFGRDSAATSKSIKTSEPPTADKDDQGKAAARDVPITGRIVDLEGRPIPGITVKVGSIAKAKGGNLTPWLEAVRRGERPWVAFGHLEEERRVLEHQVIPPEEHQRKAETDAQGRFRLEGLGAEKVVSLFIEGPTVAHTQLRVVTRQIEPFPARGFGYNYGPSTETIFGADFTFTAAPGRVVEGVVRDAKDGKVLKDVDVWSYSFAGTHTVGIMSLKTRTNGDGRFRLAGFPMGPGNRLLVVPNDDQPYFMREVAIPDPQGLRAIPVEVDLHKGNWIEGKVTDKETGSPVAGAFLLYLPFLDNKFAHAAPEFHGGHVDGYEQRYVSKSDGTFRLVGLPGRAIVGAVVYSGKPYRRGAGAESIKGMDEKGSFATAFNPINANRLFPTSMKEINPAEGAETVHVDIELDPGAKVHLRVVDPQGKPVAGVKTAGRRDRGQYEDEAQAQAEFDVVTLGPGEDRLVLLVHEGRKLGRAIHVKEGDEKSGPVVVTLEPSATITGRIVDRDGNPVSGATIQRYPKQPDPGFPIQLPILASGLDGRFTVANVATGCGYSLVAEESRPALEPTRRGFARRDVTVRPGETTDLGEVPLQRRP